MAKLNIEKLVVYSHDKEEFFETDFGPSLNIVYGRNTSGKSTLIQSIIYSMGINYAKDNLDAINSNDTVFRLDCKLLSNGKTSDLIFLRSQDTIVVHQSDVATQRFDGISGNTSFEYTRYKKYFSETIGFDLLLQNKSDLVSAPLESSLLPFYISQSVGWVYIRDSIGDYRWYKDFKFDYLDYYCGIASGHKMLERYDLEKEKHSLSSQLKNLEDFESKDISLKVSKIISDKLEGNAEAFFTKHTKTVENLTNEQSKHSNFTNKISFLRNREKILNQVIKNVKNQKPKIDQCPTCEQILPGNIEDFYVYSQDINDAYKEKEKVKKDLKSLATSVNSLDKVISSLRFEISQDYSMLKAISVDEFTVNTWIDHKANMRMIDVISLKKADVEKKIEAIKKRLSESGDSNSLDESRVEKENHFYKIFSKKAKSLGVSVPKNSKYRRLYSINSFPNQGVELHSLLMAYNFAFYDMVFEDDELHKFPFLLDGAFKEDIDTASRAAILKFLSNESSKSKQILISIAEYKDDDVNHNPLFDVEKIKEDFFESDTQLICIGGGKTKHSFLSKIESRNQSIIDETISLFESV